jgi:phospholipid transport system substrate-binding protein
MSIPRLGLSYTLVPVVILTLLASGEAAGGPLDQLRKHVERTLAILEDPAMQGEGRVRERRAVIRRIADDLFDFAEMARRSLGRHWRARTVAELAEFTDLFADLLEHAYIVRIEEYGGEPIGYRLASIEDDYATVNTTITTKGGAEVRVNYRMHREGDRWLVYDVVVEGVSLVANYRTQFNRIIETSSWAELVQRMRAKAAGAAA